MNTGVECHSLSVSSRHQTQNGYKSPSLIDRLGCIPRLLGFVPSCRSYRALREEGGIEAKGIAVFSVAYNIELQCWLPYNLDSEIWFTPETGWSYKECSQPLSLN